MEHDQAPERRLADEVDDVARRYARAVCDGDAPHAEIEGAELTAMVLMRHYIDARLTAKGPYIAEYSPPSRPDADRSGA
jgi:hypothetical protein